MIVFDWMLHSGLRYVLACALLFAGRSLAAQALSTPVVPRPANIPTLYRPDDGPYTAGIADDLTLHDPQTKRDIPLKVYYPTAKGPFPVIVFSHGAGGSKENYGLLARYWTSWGYVCVLPTHADSLVLRRAQQTDNNSDPPQTLRNLDEPAAWQGRARDITFVIDSLEKLQRMATELRGKLDRTHIGVGGHSFGAYTAMLIGGATVTLPGANTPTRFADMRPRAFLALSAEGPGRQGLGSHSWDTFVRPLMTMTGSMDRGVQGQGPNEKQQAFHLSPPGDKYAVYIEGANHFTFTGGLLERAVRRPPPNILRLQQRFGGRVPDPARLFAYVKSASLAFWDAMLKNDAQARAWLHSDQLVKASNSQVGLLRR